MGQIQDFNGDRKNLRYHFDVWGKSSDKGPSILYFLACVRVGQELNCLVIEALLIMVLSLEQATNFVE